MVIRYRPADRSFSLRQPDGGGLRLLPRRLVLEDGSEPALAGLRRLGRALAGHLGWTSIAPAQPATPAPGAILAVPRSDSRRAWAELLARARWVDGGSRPGWLDSIPSPPETWTKTPEVMRADPPTQDDPAVVIVTPAGWTALRRTPQKGLQSLAAFARRYPGAEVVEARDAEHLPTPLPLARLVAAVERLARAEAAARTGRAMGHAGEAPRGAAPSQASVGAPVPANWPAAAGREADTEIDTENVPSADELDPSGRATSHVPLTRQTTVLPGNSVPSSKVEEGSENGHPAPDRDQERISESSGTPPADLDPPEDPDDDLSPF